METNLHFSGKNIGIAHQEGAVLITSLILLLVMTMLGISAMESTKLETRMVANVIEYNRTFQIAEAGLITASNEYISDASLLLDIKQDGIWTEAQTSEYEEPHGKADLCLMKSGTQRDGGTDITQRFFVVESTGCSTTDCNNAVQVKLTRGLVSKEPKNTNTKNTKINKAPLEGFLGTGLSNSSPNTGG